MTQRDRGKRNRLYEVNMCRYCRGSARMVSIAYAERIRRERISESGPGQQRLRSDTARPLLKLRLALPGVAECSKALVMISYMISY